MKSENGNAKVKLIVIILIIFLVIYGVYVYKKGSNKKRDFLDEENKVVYREIFSDQLDARPEKFTNYNIISNELMDEIKNKNDLLVQKNEIDKKFNTRNVIIKKW